MDHTGQSFVSTSGAVRWEDGQIVGTGSTGALLWGTGSEMSVDLAHEEFFLPVNSRIEPPALAGEFGVLRTATLEGRLEEVAAHLIDAATRGGSDQLVWTDPFVPAATLRISGAAPFPEVQRRTIDLASGRASVNWHDGLIEVSADRLADQISVRIESHAPVRLSLGVTTTTAEHESMIVVGYRDRITVVATADTAVLRCEVRATRPTSTRVARTMLQLDPTPNRVDVEGGEAFAFFDRGGPITATIAIEVDKEDTPTPAVLNAVPCSHRDLVARSTLDLRTPGFPDTDSLLARARAGDPIAARGAIEFAFSSGRSNAIASTGALPPNLVGVWQGTWSPEWSGDYTLNGNLQNGAVAALISTGTPELMLSVFRLVDRFREDFRTNARRLFGSSGAFVPARVSTHGLANHFTVDYPHVFWLGGGAWILRLAFDYFSATGDLRFVEEWAMPFAVEVVTLYSDLVADIDGVLHLAPSYSPENTPNGHRHPIAADATSDIQMLRDALLIGARFARLVDDEPRATEWLRCRDQVAPYRIAGGGELAEWLPVDYDEQPAHRHTSHLYPLWYEGEERFDDPVLRAAAARTIAARMAYRSSDVRPSPGHMEMAFGLQQLGLAAARLGDANTALQCAEWLALLHWTPAGTSTHDAGAIFNMDSAGSLPSLVTGMLLTAEPEALTVFPALPTQWPSGRFSGFRGHGGIAVDSLEWHGGAAELTLHRVQGSDAAWPARAALHAGPGWIVLGDHELPTDGRTRSYRLRRTAWTA